MIQLLNFNIDYFDNNKNIITWEVEPTAASLSDYVLDVYRSDAIGSTDLDGFLLIASGINPNDYSYNDTTISGWAYYGRDWFYKFKVRNLVTLEETIQPETAFYIGYDIFDKATLEIIRRKKLVLKKTYIGRKAKLLKRKTWGAHCPRCWDPELFRTIDGNCPICYGTGWEDGYYKPIEFWSNTNAAPEYKQILMFGEWKPSDQLLYLLNYPLVKAKDVIVDDEGKRWMAVQVRYTKKLERIIEQQVQLALIAPDDIIYRVLTWTS